MSCIDLSITDQPNLFVDFGVHPSLDNHCQHQIIHRKINVSVSPPLPFKLRIWYYARAKKDQIKSAIENVDWPTIFSGLDVDDMTELFTSTRRNIFLYIFLIRSLRVTTANGNTEFTISTLSVDGNQTIENMYDQFVTKLPQKLTKPKATTFLTSAKSI